LSDPKAAGKIINNGFFEITYKEDGVYLSVYPPVEKGKAIEARDVMDKLAKKLVRNFSREIIDAAVRKADKVPVKIAEPQAEAKIDATANVMVSPDKMKAFVSFNPSEGGRMMAIEEVLDVLNKNGVIYGINRMNMETIIKYPVFNEMFCVAEGVMPLNGQNGRVEFYFDIKRDGKPAIMEDGRVDFRELNLIESVKKGQKLCELIPPVPGVIGKTVLGTDIYPVEGKPAVLPKGRNISLTEDGMAIVSNIDGQVRFIDGKINIFSTYEVPADVDNSTGNINFVGNV